MLIIQEDNHMTELTPKAKTAIHANIKNLVANNALVINVTANKGVIKDDVIQKLPMATEKANNPNDPNKNNFFSAVPDMKY